MLQLPHHKNDDGELGGLEYRGLLGSVQLWNFFGDESRLVKILRLVRNHVKLLRVINSRRGFSKGTVLYGGY